MVVVSLCAIISPGMQLPRATTRARFRPIGRAGAREPSSAALPLPQHALTSSIFFPSKPAITCNNLLAFKIYMCDRAAPVFFYMIDIHRAGRGERRFLQAPYKKGSGESESNKTELFYL